MENTSVFVLKTCCVSAEVNLLRFHADHTNYSHQIIAPCVSDLMGASIRLG